MLQIEGTYKAKMISIAEYLHTNYKVYLLVNAVISHENNQPNMNLSIKTAGRLLKN